MQTLPQDWKEFLSGLLRHRVKFLVVGAHALAANGHPRATLDLDIFVEPTNANALKLGKALSEFGFPALAQAAAAFGGDEARMATVGKEPLRIDIMNAIDGVTFDRAWRGKTIGDVDGMRIPFLGIAELVANKKSTGRVKDALDVEALKALRKNTKAQTRTPKTKEKKG